MGTICKEELNLSVCLKIGADGVFQSDLINLSLPDVTEILAL